MTSTSLPRGLNSQATAKVSFNNAARQAQNAQSAAEAFSSNADNVTTGKINPDQLPIATTSSPGIVQPDGVTVDVDPSGVISVPDATTSTVGVSKPDGSTITVVAGTLSTVSPRPCVAHTVATLPSGLPSPYNDGVFASDATLTMTAGIGTVVIGGGANKVPVYTTDSGTTWRIG